MARLLTLLCALLLAPLAMAQYTPPPAVNSEPLTYVYDCVPGDPNPNCWTWAPVTTDCNGNPFGAGQWIDHYNLYYNTNYYVDIWCDPSGTQVDFCYCDADFHTGSCPADPTYCEDYNLTQGYYPSPGTTPCGFRTNSWWSQPIQWENIPGTDTQTQDLAYVYPPGGMNSSADQPMVYWYYLEAVDNYNQSSFDCP